MKLRWLFRRRQYATVLPAALTMEQYRAMCIGEEVLILAEHTLKQARFVPLASNYMQYRTLGGECFEVSVAAKAPDRPTIDDPLRA